MCSGTVNDVSNYAFNMLLRVFLNESKRIQKNCAKYTIGIFIAYLKTFCGGDPQEPISTQVDPQKIKDAIGHRFVFIDEPSQEIDLWSNLTQITESAKRQVEQFLKEIIQVIIKDSQLFITGTRFILYVP